MKGKHHYLKTFGALGIGVLFLVLLISCSKEEVAVETVPNPNPGPAKLVSEIEITQDAFNQTMTIRETGVADPETGELLSPEATEIPDSGITYTIVPGSCTATQPAGWRTCCQLNITNNTGSSISSVILLGDAAVSNSPVAARSGNSGTGYDGSGTGWGNVAASNGGYALWMVASASGNVIPNGGSSDPRTICIESPTGYSVSRWRLYQDAILGKIVDRDTGTAISGGWAMLGNSSPDNNFPELGNGNYVQTDAQGNFGFPYLGAATNFTYTVGANGYARQTIFGTTNKNITLSLKSLTLRSRVAVGNYNGTLATLNQTPNPSITCGQTGNVGCDGYLRIGVLAGALGYEDIASLSLESLIGPGQFQTVWADTGSCTADLTQIDLDVLPSNVILPQQNEYPIVALGYNNAAMSAVKLEWWLPSPSSTSNVTITSIWGLIPKSALEALLAAVGSGGPANLASLVMGINPQCTGWRRNISTGATNLQGQAFTINKANTQSATLTLQNLVTTPTTTYSRTVLALMGVEFTNNIESYQRLGAISLAGASVNTVGNANIPLPFSTSLAADEYLVPLVLEADLDKNANTWDASAVVAIADRGSYKSYSSRTINTFFGLPSLTWSTINSNTRRVAHASPERAIGTPGGSPWVDVGIGIISKTSLINTITEETASCGVGAGCCDKQDASGRCQYDQKGSQNLWEFLIRGRTSSTSGPQTDWTIPDLPASVDLPLQNPTNYPDGNYPSLTIVETAWCPGSPLCTANATSNEFPFDANGSITDVLNNTTHLATNKFDIGGARIINPPNQASLAAGTITVNGFVTAGNWSDYVSCDRVYVETWQTYTSGTSAAEECGTCPAGTACGSTAVNTGCPATHCCSSSTAMTALQTNGCGAGLPSPCFTIGVPLGTNRWRHVKIEPKLGGAYANSCGEGSGEWYFKNGNP